MKILTTTIGAALLVASGLVEAHAHLESSTPAEGSTLKVAPPALELKFSEAVSLTALTLGKPGEKGQPLAVSAKTPAAKVNVPLPQLMPGKYVISYRAVSDDNHVMSGMVHFSIGAASDASAGAMDHSKMPGMDHGGAAHPSNLPAGGADHH